VTLELTDRVSVLSEYVHDLLTTNADMLGLEVVYDGDQKLIHKTPAVAVEAGGKQRELVGMPTQTNANMTIYVMVYVGKVNNTQSNYRDALLLAETIEDLLHADRDPETGRPLQGLLIWGMVTAVEPGFAQRGNTVYRTTRLTYEGFSKVVGLPAG
jgi:hypothetical protein